MGRQFTIIENEEFINFNRAARDGFNKNAATKEWKILFSNIYSILYLILVLI